MSPWFGFYRIRFRFRAVNSIHFPEGKPGNIIRGAFGIILRKIACAPDCPSARACPRRGRCPYARIFEPGACGAGPSGLADWPRPFVFRAAHLNGLTVAARAAFHFDVHVFDLHDPAIPYFVLTFAELARSGLGPGRGRAELVAADQLDPAGQTIATLYDGGEWRAQTDLRPSAIPLTVRGEAANLLRIEFLTPTELKFEQRLVARPEFPILFGRIRDRIGNLNALYGAGPLELDFKAIGDRAAAIRMSRCDVAHVDVERRSSRTGQRHPMGGFIGSAEYEGDLAEFIPYLEAAEYAGVGRQTAFGNGEIRITSPARDAPAA